MICRLAAMTLLSLALALNESRAAGPIAPPLEWLQQVGTSGYDESFDITSDDFGNVYLAGRTSGSWGGANSGSQDGFVSKYDGMGALQWVRQLDVGSSALWCNGISADGAGNVYIGGHTRGDLGGQLGDWDAFVGKYDSSGNLLWTRQLGTSGVDFGLGVSADLVGNVYITGYTLGALGGPNAGERDAYLAKYDAGGALQWTRQLGTSANDEGSSIATDGSGDVYITGHTAGSLAGPNAGQHDAFVSKFTSTGTSVWTRQFGTNRGDESYGVATDGSGSVYLTGFTGGSLAAPSGGDIDMFLRKYDAFGTPVWTQQLGTPSSERGNGVAVSEFGSVFVTGATRGSLSVPHAGGDDIFVIEYTDAGHAIRTRQLGTSADDVSNGVTVDGSGAVFITGYTQGQLVTPNPGGGDVFIAKFANIPEPSTSALIIVMLSLRTLARRRT